MAKGAIASSLALLLRFPPLNFYQLSLRDSWQILPYLLLCSLVPFIQNESY